MIGKMRLLDPTGPAEILTARLDAAVALAKAARAPADTWADQLAHVPALQLNTDRAIAARRDESCAEEQDFKRLRHSKVFDLPAVWRGKRHHRAEAQGDEKAQQKLDWKKAQLTLELASRQLVDSVVLRRDSA